MESIFNEFLEKIPNEINTSKPSKKWKTLSEIVGGSFKMFDGTLKNSKLPSNLKIFYFWMQKYCYSFWKD